jgi:hypothetical protein
VGRGTLASGHPSFPLIIVAVPVLFAERLISAFAALHPEWGNNANSNFFLPPFLKRPGDLCRCKSLTAIRQRPDTKQTLFQFWRQSASAFQTRPEVRWNAAPFRPLSPLPQKMRIH